MLYFIEMIEINKINGVFCKDWIKFQTNEWLHIKVNKINTILDVSQ